MANSSQCSTDCSPSRRTKRDVSSDTSHLLSMGPLMFVTKRGKFQMPNTCTHSVVQMYFDAMKYVGKKVANKMTQMLIKFFKKIQKRILTIANTCNYVSIHEPVDEQTFY